MANSNIQQFPLLAEAERIPMNRDVILLLRNGFPYRLRFLETSMTITGGNSFNLSEVPNPDPEAAVANPVLSRTQVGQLYKWADIEYREGPTLAPHFTRLSMSMLIGADRRDSIRIPGDRGITTAGNGVITITGTGSFESATLRNL